MHDVSIARKCGHREGFNAAQIKAGGERFRAVIEAGNCAACVVRQADEEWRREATCFLAEYKEVLKPGVSLKCERCGEVIKRPTYRHVVGLYYSSNYFDDDEMDYAIHCLPCQRDTERYEEERALTLEQTMRSDGWL